MDATELALLRAVAALEALRVELDAPYVTAMVQTEAGDYSVSVNSGGALISSWDTPRHGPHDGHYPWQAAP